MLAAGTGDDELREIPEEAVPPVSRSLVFTHVDGDSPPFELGLGAQSAGTITWLAMAAPAIETLARGSLLIVDELDASLHPSLTAALVTMFKDPDLNRTGAQILFSTHDATLLGNSPARLLEPGEVWFCEKDDGSSEVFPLSDFDRAITSRSATSLAGSAHCPTWTSPACSPATSWARPSLERIEPWGKT